jgi:hypothetical protein
MFKKIRRKVKNKKMSAELETSKQQYRGFSTSITHCYQDKRFAQTDACALACCGMLQSDRDRYLVTGITPPSWNRRLFLHFLTPLALFALACYGAMNIPDAYSNQLISTMLVVFAIVIVLLQICYKGPMKRIAVRKELLWRKHQYANQSSSRAMPMPDEDDEDMEHAKVYLQGQSKWDLRCVHGVLGCYLRDNVRNSTSEEAAASNKINDLCAKLFRFGSHLCFGQLCLCQLQTCGLCGVAQEARELTLVAAHRRRIDYVTMQDSLAYYGPILKQQQGGEGTSTMSYLWNWSAALSQLSHQLIQLFGVCIVLLIALGMLLHFHLGHVLIFLGAFGHSFLVLAFVVWFMTSNTTAKPPSMDLIIKAYACGFFVCTLLAILWELLVGMAFRILIVDVLLAIAGVRVAVDDDGYEILMSTIGFGKAAAAADRQDYLSAYGQDHPLVFSILLLVNAFLLAAFLEELVKYMGYNMILDHPDFWSRTELESAISVAMQGSATKQDEYGDSSSEKSMDEQAPPETSKAASRQDLWDLPLQEQEKSIITRGATVTIAMIAVALGFACCETLVYIFVYNENSLNVGTSRR